MCLMTKKYGATTLSLAISLAHVAGISVVATQAIGGVGPINNYNLSADVVMTILSLSDTCPNHRSNQIAIIIYLVIAIQLNFNNL